MIGLYHVQDKRLNTINDNIVHFLIKSNAHNNRS